MHSSTDTCRVSFVAWLIVMLGSACARADGDAVSRIGGVQPDVVVDRANPCDDCSIELVDLGPVGSDDDPFLVDRFSKTTSWNGWTIVAPGLGDSAIGVFDSAGRFVRQVGRLGPGPQEFSSIKSIAPGSVRAALVLHGRLSLLDDDFKVRRSLTLPEANSVFRAVGLSDSRFVLNNYSPAYPPFIQVDSSLRLIRTFESIRRPSGNDPDESQYVMTAAPNGGLWVAPMYYDYWIQLIDSAGSSRSVIGGWPDWYFEYDTNWVRAWATGRASAPPRVIAVHLDDDGLLWVLTIVAADSEPVEAPSASSGNSSERESRPDPAARRPVNSIIEIIEVDSARLLVSRRFDRILTGITPDGRLTGHTTSPDGAETVHMFDVNFDIPERMTP